MRRFAPVAEGAGVERERDVLGFAGSEAGFGKTFQLALGTVDFGRWVGNVELGDLGSGYCARVGDVEADRNRGAGDGVVIRRSGAVFPTAIEGDGEPALWVVLAEEDLGDGQVRMLAGWIVYPKFGRGLSDYAQ